MVSNIASELLTIIDAKKYKQIIPPLPSGSGLSENVFPCTDLAKKYSLNTERIVGQQFYEP